MHKLPVLYIDVDGVFLGVYDGHPQPRPNIIGFLSWAVEHFKCRWMTCWPEDRLKTFMSLIHGPHIFKKIEYFNWQHEIEKDDAIDLTEDDFYWIEDGPVRDKLVGLLDANGFTRYIEVDAYGRDELYRVQSVLNERLEARKDDIE